MLYEVITVHEDIALDMCVGVVQIRGCLRQRRSLAVDQHDARALGQEQPGRRPPQAAGAAGQQAGLFV